MEGPPVRDEELLSALYAEHAAALLAFARRLLGGDEQQAEDVVQETLLRAWRHSGELTAATARRRARHSAGDRAIALLLGPPGAAPLDGGRTDPDRPPLELAATNPRTGVEARVSLGTRPWGTLTELWLRGAEPGERCRLVVRTEDGRRIVAGSWRASYAGTAEVPGAVAAAPHEIAAVDVVTADGRRLVRLAPPG